MLATKVINILLACGGDHSILIGVVDDVKNDRIIPAFEEAAAAGRESNVRKLIAPGAPTNHQRTGTVYKDALQAAAAEGIARS